MITGGLTAAVSVGVGEAVEAIFGATDTVSLLR